jgi:RHS repeat-associated protein
MTHIRAFLLAAACLLPTLGLADTVTLNPVADAYVQNGSNANRNYGTNTQLRAQTSSTAASNYDSYLRFDTATGTVTSAKLRLYASLSRAGNVSSSVHAVADTGWGETTITWNNKPALGSVLGSLSTTSTSYAWKEIDVTAYVQAEKAAGRNLISLGLHNAATSSVYVRASSRNATSNKPELVIVSETPPPPPPPVAAGVYYIYADHLNTPRVITDGTNKVVWRWDSDPFGADAANEDPDGDGAKFRYNLRFPGQYYDRETGLHYNYFRDYEPGTGRYVQSDPIGLAGGLNVYAYLDGNPLSYVDPLGLAKAIPGDAGSIGPGFGMGGGVGRGGSGGGARAPTFPSSPEAMSDFLKLPGRSIPDSAKTPGRGKVEWCPSDKVRITYEQHPYHPNAPDWHRGPHWHVDIPGQRHQRFLPGDPIPGY